MVLLIEDRVDPDSTNMGKLSDSGAQDNHYTKPDTWKTWSLERAGFRETEFEGKLCAFFS